MPTGVRSLDLFRAGSSVSSNSLTPSELEDRKAERGLKLKRATLTMEEKQWSLALEQTKALLAHEARQKLLDLKVMSLSESSEGGGSDSDVSPKIWCLALRWGTT